MKSPAVNGRAIGLAMGLALTMLANGAPLAPPIPLSRATPGVVRVFANCASKGLLRRWRQQFEKLHPPARVLVDCGGSDVAMAQLYTGRADIAVLGRDASPGELKAFEWIYRRQPQRLELATGSLTSPGHSPALALFVRRDNPLRKISLAQVDAIFGTELLGGESRGLRHWGELGLTGDWFKREIHAYGYDLAIGSGQFFQAAVLHDSRKLNWSVLREFQDSGPPGSNTHDAAAQILAALSRDGSGIAVASLAVAPAAARSFRVRLLPISINAAAAPLRPTRSSLIERSYPLTRSLNAYFNSVTDARIVSDVHEFLDYVVSSAGQQIVGRDGNYLPLSVTQQQRERLKLP